MVERTKDNGDAGEDPREAPAPAAEEGAAEADEGAAGADEGAAREQPGEPETPGHIDEVAVPTPEAETDAGEELAALHDRHLRLAAEFDNYRRRTRLELGEAGDGARADLASTLLEVVDDLQRVAETQLDATTTEALHEGIGLVARKFAKFLADAGVEQVDPLGERFDPNLHDALMMTPTEDPEEDELVSHVVLVGYRLGARLLRPARVTVFRHEEAG